MLRFAQKIKIIFFNPEFWRITLNNLYLTCRPINGRRLGWIATTYADVLWRQYSYTLLLGYSCHLILGWIYYNIDNMMWQENKAIGMWVITWELQSVRFGKNQRFRTPANAGHCHYVYCVLWRQPLHLPDPYCITYSLHCTDNILRWRASRSAGSSQIELTAVLR